MNSTHRVGVTWRGNSTGGHQLGWGALLLREAKQRTGIMKRVAACFADHRDPDRIEHTVESLVSRRIAGIAPGYQDVNDHDRLRYDPPRGVSGNQAEPDGSDTSCLG